mgnify:CR=1 FL=1
MVEFSDLKRGDLIQLCFKGYDDIIFGIVMECYIDPILYNDEHICEIYFPIENTCFHVSEMELSYWILLSKEG